MKGNDLAERILVLEGQMRLMKLVSVLAVSVCLVFLMMGFQSGPPEILRVKKLQVVRPDGAVEIELAADKDGDGGDITVADQFGAAKASLSVMHRGAFMVLGETTVQHRHSNVVALSATSFGSSIAAEDASGVTTNLAARHGKGSVEITNGKGRVLNLWPKH